MVEDSNAIVAAFGVYLLVLFGIGFVAWQRTRNLADYILLSNSPLAVV